MTFSLIYCSKRAAAYFNLQAPSFLLAIRRLLRDGSRNSFIFSTAVIIKVFFNSNLISELDLKVFLTDSLVLPGAFINLEKDKFSR